MALKFAVNNSLSDVTSLPTAIPTGSMTLLQTQTASSSASVEFTTGIDSTYDVYKFVVLNAHANTDFVGLNFTGSTNAGSSYGVTKTTTAFNARHTEDGTGSGLAYNTNGDLAQSTSSQRFIMYAMGNGADENVCGEMYLYNPSSTTFVKHFMIKSIQNDKDNQADNSFFAGYFNTTSAINAIKFEITSGTFDGVIKLYGVS